MGSAPASGAADDALVVGIAVRGCGSKQYARHIKVRREGAPNSSRGGCAPRNFNFDDSQEKTEETEESAGVSPAGFGVLAEIIPAHSPPFSLFAPVQCIDT